MKWIPITISSLNEARVQIVVIAGKRLVLVRDDNMFYIFKSKCPHAGADLGNAWCENGFLVCPVHRYKYSLQNGRGANGQGDYLKCYPTKTEGDILFIGFKKPWFKFW